jgi:hypothetical protein
MPQLESHTNRPASSGFRTMHGSFIIGTVPLRKPMTISTRQSERSRAAISLNFSVYPVMSCHLGRFLHETIDGPEPLYRRRHLVDHIDEFRRFGRGDPGKVEAVARDPHVIHQILKQCEFPTSVVITFQVMAVARMSPGNPYTVRPLPERREKKLGAHPAGARDADHTDVGGILHSPDAGQIGRAVAAPVA